MSDGGFAGFPVLPAPAASPRGSLPKQNPLLAKATVVDLSKPVQPEEPALPSAAAGGGEDDMGAAMSLQGVELSRHNKNRLVPHRPKPHAHRPRQKVLFEKGYSQVDWVRLTQKDPDLAGLKGAPRRRDITLEEVAQHANEDDAWTVLRGRVYNMTPYLRFHPGGVPLLLKVAGRDGTALFNKYHAWVNADYLLEKCLVGFLAPQGEAGIMPPPPPVAKRQQQQPPSEAAAGAQQQEAQQAEVQAAPREGAGQEAQQRQQQQGSPEQQRQQLGKLPPPRQGESIGLSATAAAPTPAQ